MKFIGQRVCYITHAPSTVFTVGTVKSVNLLYRFSKVEDILSFSVCNSFINYNLTRHSFTVLVNPTSVNTDI